MRMTNNVPGHAADDRSNDSIDDSCDIDARRPPEPPSFRKTRWGWLLAVSILLHALLLTRADNWILRPNSTAVEQTAAPIITAMLIPSAPAEVASKPAAVTLPAAKPIPKPPKRSRPARTEKPARVPAAPKTSTATIPAEVPALAAAAVAKPTSEVTPPTTPPADDMQTTKADQADGETDTEAAAPAPAPAPALVPAAAATKSTSQSPHNIRPPPSVQLVYEVRYATRGTVTHGSSIVDWQFHDDRYTIKGEITKFGFSLSSFSSEGGIDASGLTPSLYTEKNARRSQTNTHFSRDERAQISFSASTNTYTLIAGAQDRASILWQLAAIGRGDPTVLKPGTAIDIFVAGTRDAEHWSIDVIGEEAIALEHQETRAWHLVRAPHPGTYDKQIDIWLAPDLAWYPVKLRYTEVSGDYLDLSLSEAR